jgi:hypothetical protein
MEKKIVVGHNETEVAMPTSSFIRRNDHGIGVEIMADYL